LVVGVLASKLANAYILEPMRTIELKRPARLKRASMPPTVPVSFAIGRLVSCHALPSLLLVALLLCFVSACHSPNRDVTNRMASIIVTNCTASQIDAAIRTVFERNFTLAGDAGEPLVYERRGSFMNGVVYGDWGDRVWERVRVYQRPLDQTRTLIDCDATMVKGHGDPFFEEEQKTYGTRKTGYQNLLNEVKKSLNPGK
jgi:hypothetical protein